MRAVSPVIPEANEPERVFAENHPEYQPLPSIRREDGVILTRWILSAEEMEAVSRQGFIYLAVIVGDKGLQPVKLTAEVPEEFQNYKLVDEEWPDEING